jgi:hypothetical protein
VPDSDVPGEPYRLVTCSLGVREGVCLDKANQLARELEDAELLQKYESCPPG